MLNNKDLDRIKTVLVEDSSFPENVVLLVAEIHRLRALVEVVIEERDNAIRQGLEFVAEADRLADAIRAHQGDGSWVAGRGVSYETHLAERDRRLWTALDQDDDRVEDGPCSHEFRTRMGAVEGERWSCVDCGYSNDQETDR